MGPSLVNSGRHALVLAPSAVLDVADGVFGLRVAHLPPFDKMATTTAISPEASCARLSRNALLLWLVFPV